MKDALSFEQAVKKAHAQFNAGREAHNSEITTLRAQIETLTRERDVAIRKGLARETALHMDLGDEREKVRRLVECVHLVDRLSLHIDRIGYSTALEALLAAVSDITTTDEVQS